MTSLNVPAPIFFILAVITLTIYIFIGYLALSRWKKSPMHRRFTFLILFSFLWVLVVYLEHFNNPKSFDTLFHIDFVLAPLPAYFIVLFALHFPDRNKNVKLIHESLLFIPILFISILGATDLIVTTTNLTPQYNLSLYIFYFAVIVFYFLIVGLGVLVRKYFKISGIQKLQVAYVLIGYMISIIILLGVSLLNAIAYSVLTPLLTFLSESSAVIFAIFISFAVFRYRFLDVGLIIRKSVIHLASLLLMMSFYIYLLLFFQKYLREQYSWSDQTATILLVLIIVLTLGPLRRFLFKVIDRAFYARERQVRLESKKLRFIFSSTLQFRELMQKISDELKSVFRVESLQFLLYNKATAQLETYWPQQKEKIILNYRDPLFEYLRNHPEILVVEEISYLLEEKSPGEIQLLKKIEGKLKELNVALVLPIGEQDELLGVFLLGTREKREAFTIENIQSLANFQNQATFALANALLYKQAVERIGKV